MHALNTRLIREMERPWKVASFHAFEATASGAFRRISSSRGNLSDFGGVDGT